MGSLAEPSSLYARGSAEEVASVMMTLSRGVWRRRGRDVVSGESRGSRARARRGGHARGGARCQILGTSTRNTRKTLRFLASSVHVTRARTGSRRRGRRARAPRRRAHGIRWTRGRGVGSCASRTECPRLRRRRRKRPRDYTSPPKLEARRAPSTRVHPSRARPDSGAGDANARKKAAEASGNNKAAPANSSQSSDARGVRTTAPSCRRRPATCGCRRS